MKCMILKCILTSITNNCKPPQNLDFPETELSVRFICFGKFLWVCYFCSMGGWNILPVLCFTWSYKWKFQPGIFLQKTISNMAGSCKNIKKHQNAPTRTQKKSQILLRGSLDEYTKFSTPPPLPSSPATSPPIPFFEERI